ncbi:MAG: nucleotidyltransferase domain-containing protein [Alphaproteobacteria bacterium]|nr:nucleotidyltransferase domain-containing protein [Alphaproteobacteria bacterium]
MNLIVEIRAGSHLYGTATEASDVDYKAVYVPTAEDILLQRVRDTISETRPKVTGERNVAGDVDRETFALHRYLALLAAGQTVALDMLFAPDAAMMRAPAPLWREIQANAPRLVTRRASLFVRYCRQQANRYGIRGSRVAAARQALATLTVAEATYGTTARLADAEAEIVPLAQLGEHIALVDLSTPGGGTLRHLEVCGRKMPFSASIKLAREIAERLVEEYGARSLQAERNEGIDWKALSHAVRVGREALELLSSGRITLPLPYAAEILAIKRGEVAYGIVAETIERLLVEVEAAASASPLPETPDQGFIDALVARTYRAVVLEAGR